MRSKAALWLSVISAAAALLVTPASADEAWRVVDTAGAVRAGGAGFMPVALTRDQTLPADAWVETAAGARAVLVRGQETIVVAPNSRVQLPDEEVNGNTQVLQTMGSALYKIGKQKKPHFQVDTPYLAAVVKGTQFTVTVGDGDAAVTVTEGLVEVATPDGKDVEFVPPGFTATVGGDSKGDVTVRHTPGSEGAPPPRGDHDQPKSDESAEQEKSKPDQAADAGRPVLIPVSVGEIDIDVKEVSGGLAFGGVKTALVETTESTASEKERDKSTDDSADGTALDGAAASDSTKDKHDESTLSPNLVPGDSSTVVDGGAVKEERGGGDSNSIGDLTPVLGGGPTTELGAGTNIGNGSGNTNGNAGGNGQGNTNVPPDEGDRADRDKEPKSPHVKPQT